MVLERHTLVTKGRLCSVCSLFRSQKQHTLRLYGSFTQEMVLKRPFTSDSGEDCTLSVHCSGLLETEFIE